VKYLFLEVVCKEIPTVIQNLKGLDKNKNISYFICLLNRIKYIVGKEYHNEVLVFLYSSFTEGSIFNEYIYCNVRPFLSSLFF